MNKDTNKGFTLIEIMMVIAVIAILVAVLVPPFKSYLGTVKKVICNDNCMKAEKKYEMYLDIENKSHSEGVFIHFLEEYENTICPDGGTIEYWDEKVQCNTHSIGDDNGSNDEDDEDVPFL